jgi:hypothetical protein
MIHQLNLRILKEKMARWPPSGHHWAVVLEWGGGGVGPACPIK